MEEISNKEGSLWLKLLLADVGLTTGKDLHSSEKTAEAKTGM